MSERASDMNADKATDSAVAEGVSPQTIKSLTPKEEKEYGRMAHVMSLYHDHFRQDWDRIYKACTEANTTNEDEPKISTSLLIHMILLFISQLTAHHNIEEHHIFPILGERMPEFRNSDSDGIVPGGPLAQHREIHAGLDALDDYLSACRAGEKKFQRRDVKDILESFGEVLFKHLDEEVAHLGAKNMQKYWTLDEMKMLPM